MKDSVLCGDSPVLQTSSNHHVLRSRRFSPISFFSIWCVDYRDQDSYRHPQAEPAQGIARLLLIQQSRVCWDFRALVRGLVFFLFFFLVCCSSSVVFCQFHISYTPASIDDDGQYISFERKAVLVLSRSIAERRRRGGGREGGGGE